MAGNSFGTLFRYTTWGESHGVAIGCVVDGVPPRLPLAEADIQHWLDRRRPGQSKFTTQRREPDAVKILSGVFEGQTTGAPIALLIENIDQRAKDYSAIKDQFRPGHADFTYQAKYGIRDYRGGGRASARETAMRVAAGAIARKVLGDGIGIKGALIQIGQDRIDRAKWNWNEVENNPFWCPDAAAAERWEALLMDVRKRGSSLGAVIEVVASGVPAGLGEPAYDKLDADLAKAIMSINAVKGVEIGAGFRRGGAGGRGQRRRDPHRQRWPTVVPVQQRRRRSRRYLDRSGRRGPVRGQADQLDPDPAPLDRPLRQRGRGDHQGPPRPLRRHPRGPSGRGDARDRARRPFAAPARARRLRKRRP